MRIIIAGGFLGAGKTTLLWAAARELISRGMKVGIITNDQAPDLVDTTLLLRQGLDVREVAGSCFCCNFDGLLRAIDELKDVVRADVLLAEPVGSCTDLSATLLQPLKEKLRKEIVISPFSVLVDPARAREVLSGPDGTMHPSAAYIFRKQLEEADRILINKSDLLAPDALREVQEQISREIPGTRIRPLSSRTGEGIAAWLDDVFSDRHAGTHLADIDYDIYAEGEAAMGWLNAEIRVAAPSGVLEGGEAVCRALMEGLRDAFLLRSAPVGHVKLLMEAEGGHIVSNLTRAGGEIEYRGALPGASGEARLILNARVEMPPKTLENVVLEQLDRLACDGLAVRILRVRSLAPSRPVPTHRYARIVEEKRGE